jgi:hypothetical protein
MPSATVPLAVQVQKEKENPMRSVQNCRNHALLLPVSAGTLLALASACSPAQAPVKTESQPSVPREFSFRVAGAGPGTADATMAFAEHGVEFHLAGNLEIGPAPNGQVHKALLADKEREQLQKSWNAWLKTGFTATENCVALDATSELASLNARISILQNDKKAAQIRVDGGQICGPSEKSALEDFSKTLIALAKSHYPHRFPSECLASTDALQATQQSLLSCQTNEDCVHVDAQYAPIAAGEVQYVPLKSCSVLPRLTAASASLLKSNRKAILAAQEGAKQACAEETRELTCTTDVDVGFQNHRHPARCIANQCVPGKRLR